MLKQYMFGVCVRWLDGAALLINWKHAHRNTAQECVCAKELSLKLRLDYTQQTRPLSPYEPHCAVRTSTPMHCCRQIFSWALCEAGAKIGGGVGSDRKHSPSKPASLIPKSSSFGIWVTDTTQSSVQFSTDPPKKLLTCQVRDTALINRISGLGKGKGGGPPVFFSLCNAPEPGQLGKPRVRGVVWPAKDSDICPILSSSAYSQTQLDHFSSRENRTVCICGKREPYIYIYIHHYSRVLWENWQVLHETSCST